MVLCMVRCRLHEAIVGATGPGCSDRLRRQSPSVDTRDVKSCCKTIDSHFLPRDATQYVVRPSVCMSVRP